MSYRASLDYLYGLQRFGIKLGLENVRTLLERLSHPERAFRVIHIAGTNGKGSTAVALAAILQACGYRTGLYTSPHLHSFTERIRIDGVPVAESEVAARTDRLRPLVNDLPITFFEFTTAMALDVFRDRQVDVAVLETGMGGRLDATNAVDPVLALITPVSLDHQLHLGAGLAQIAAEKGGIIKPGVPVLTAQQDPDVLQVLLRIAGERGSPLRMAGRDWQLVPAADGFEFVAAGWAVQVRSPRLLGRHQYGNLGLALAAAAELAACGWRIDPPAAARAAAAVSWPGRLEWWPGDAGVLLDGAHNPDGIAVLRDYLDEAGLRGLHWVVGIKQDKAAREMLELLAPLVDTCYCTRPPVEGGSDPELLAREARSLGCRTEVVAEPAEALRAALHNRPRGATVLVAGSLFLVAAAREWLQVAPGLNRSL